MQVSNINMNPYASNNLRKMKDTNQSKENVSMTSHYEVPIYNVNDEQARVLNKVKHHMEVDSVCYTEPGSDYYFRFWVPDDLDKNIEKKLDKYAIYYTKWSGEPQDTVDNEDVATNADHFYDVDVY